MKLSGEFVVRQVVDTIVAVPVGETALRLNGMILLNEVSKTIWDQLEQGAELAQLVSAVTDVFDVSAEKAQADILEFCDKLRALQLLEE